MQPVSTSDSAADQTRQRFPHLSISDLLVLTLTLSLGLACVAPDLQDFLALPPEDRRISNWRAIVPSVAEYLAIGIALFGLIVLARQRLRGSTCPLAPGHWIFLTIGPYLVLLLTTGAWRVVMATYWFNNHRSFDVAVNVLFAVTLVASAVCPLWARQALERRWWICLALLLLWLLLGATFCMYDAFLAWSIWKRHLLVATVMTYLLAFVTSCIAAVKDWMSGARRDWLHHFAITTLALFAISYVLNYDRLLAQWWGDLRLHLLP